MDTDWQFITATSSAVHHSSNTAWSFYTDPALSLKFATPNVQVALFDFTCELKAGASGTYMIFTDAVVGQVNVGSESTNLLRMVRVDADQGANPKSPGIATYEPQTLMWLPASVSSNQVVSVGIDITDTGVGGMPPAPATDMTGMTYVTLAFRSV